VRQGHAPGAAGQSDQATPGFGRGRAEGPGALGDLGQNKIPEVLPEPPPKRRFLGFLSRK
jgi:hypothetical protein